MREAVREMARTRAQAFAMLKQHLDRMKSVLAGDGEGSRFLPAGDNSSGLLPKRDAQRLLAATAILLVAACGEGSVAPPASSPPASGRYEMTHIDGDSLPQDAPYLPDCPTSVLQGHLDLHSDGDSGGSYRIEYQGLHPPHLCPPETSLRDTVYTTYIGTYRTRGDSLAFSMDLDLWGRPQVRFDAGVTSISI